MKRNNNGLWITMLSAFLLACFAPVYADVVINEIVANGNPDWIELYNTGESSVDLSGAFLSDSPSQLDKWRFPDGTSIGGKKFLVVYASGDALADQVPDALNANFKISVSGEKIILSHPNLSLWDYVDPKDLSMYGDVVYSWGRFPNGIGGFRLFTTPSRGKSNGEMTLYADNLAFNEVMPNNRKTIRSHIIDPTDGFNGYYDWIELVNKGGSSLCLDGYSIDDEDDTWYFPAGVNIPAYRHLLIFASNKNQVIRTPDGPEIHTNFKVSAAGSEPLTLLNPDSYAVDFLCVGAMGADRSIGRMPDASGNFTNLLVPSPGAANSNAGANVAGVIVNEVACSETRDWVELYNTNSSAVSLAGAYLSDDDANRTKWQFPVQATIPAKGYLLVYATGNDTVIYDDHGNIIEMHTNFLVKNDGKEPVIFSSLEGTYISRIDKANLNMSAGQSASRIPDASGTILKVNSQTPGSANINLVIPYKPEAQNLVINEVVSFNQNNLNLNLTTYPGGNGQDWIEIYNNSGVAVNLEGLLLDTGSAVWMFPSYDLAAYGKKIVFASGRNIRTGNEWHTNFTLDESRTTSLRLLNTNRALIQEVNLVPLGRDQSYSRIPDGNGPFTLVSQPSPEASNSNTPVQRSPDRAAISINEVCSNNLNDVNLAVSALSNNSKQDWIEIKNNSDQPVNLKNFRLSDARTTWVFPDFTLPGQDAAHPGQNFLLIYASGSPVWLINGTLHANFAISASDGETITLSDKDGSAIESVQVPALGEDYTYARISDGRGDFHLCAAGTPGAANELPQPHPQGNFITINEIVSNNQNNVGLNLALYQYGNRQDWIELYNKGDSPVDLAGLKLADSTTSWVFPHRTTLGKGDYLLVFASGRDLHGPELHTNFAISSSKGEVIRLLDRDNTVLESVSVPPLSADKSFSRLPNGIGSIFKTVTLPTPGNANSGSIIEPNEFASNITINEVVSKNDNNVGFANIANYPEGNGEDWIELYNKGRNRVNLQDMMLVDYASGTAWAFPPGAALDAGRYLLVFASGKDLFGSELHTNFRISASSAQTLGLLNTDGSEIERLTVPPLAADESYSRIPDAAGLFQITLRPTPEAQNSAAPVEPTPGAENLVINELVANNANNVGLSLVQYPGGDKLDWIEIYNKGNTAVKMGGLKLSDAKNTWIFPDSVPDLEAHQFLLVFSSGGGPNVRELHTNFRISSDTGEVISLLNKNNQVIDSLKVWLLAADECYARYPDGTGTAVVMTTPTPGMANLDRRVTNPAGASDILINEVVSANQNNLGLDLNKYPGASSCDWIELYNKGSQSVNLGGLKLFASNQGWRFPDVTLGAREYRLVFASGRNWLDNELHTNFAIGATKKEQLLLLNKDNSQIQEVIVPPLEADQSFSRIRPGTATSDFAIVRDPTPEALNSNVLVDRRYPPPGKCPIVINEVLSNNAHNQNLNLGQYPGGNRQDWIELYNSGSQPVDLIGLKLMSESADTQGRFFGNGTAWVFPSVVLQPGDYRLVFASGMDLRGSELHTNFAISSTWGERLQLLDRENSVIQTVDIPQLAADVSFAARPNGDKNSFSVCTSPTPGAFNPGGIILPPVVSITSPANNAFIAAGINKTISVSTSASSGRSISRIEFFNGAEKIGESAASPFSLVWNNVPEGAYALTAKATDSAGAYTVSQAITGEAVLYGDVNVDGSVTAIDASMAARNAVGTLNLSSAQVRKADVNNIAGVTASDASWIARKAVGSVALFPIEQG